MARHSFFVDPGSIQEDRAELRGQTAHQIAKVLRLQQGDVIDLLDNSGFVYPARIVAVSKSGVRAEILERRPLETEPRVELVLYQALLKGQKYDWVLQKGAEIGVSRFVPVLSERCVSRPSASDVRRKTERWTEIVREAAEQSKRAVIPQLGALLSFEDACRDAGGADLAVMPWEGETSQGLGVLLSELGSVHREQAPGSGRGDACVAPTQDSGLRTRKMGDRTGRLRVALLVGPEGGFSEREAEVARAAGVSLVSLGPRILRAETAALVATTVVLYERGDLGG